MLYEDNFPEIVIKAWEFAKEKHGDQKDDCGGDYFNEHICMVVEILKEVTWDPSTLACGFLHDTLEDTNTTYEELVENFGQKIADLVNEVTQEGKKDQIGYYFPRLHSLGAIMVKFADRLSNLSRMGAWDEKRKQQYLKKSVFWKKEAK